jgi:N-methylhydantoinase B/oxoprolinase/acetone carboxylase alpha subunit
VTGLQLDGIGLEILWGRLIGVADDMWTTVHRTAVSSIIGAAQDFGCELLTPDGDSLAHATRSMPAFNMVMPTLTRGVMARFPPSDMRDGDVFVTNDPWICCGHLDDIAVVSPVYRRGTLVAFVATAAHASSIGGALAGRAVRDLYEEGLRIPVTRLVAAGERNETAWAFICDNVRTPELVTTDIEAEIAANWRGAQRIRGLLDEYGLADLREVAKVIQHASERAMRTAIRALPDGEYESEVVADGTGEPIILRCRLVVTGDAIVVNYAGSAPQRLGGGVNCPFAYTRAHTVYGLQCLLAPDVPANEGTIRPIAVAAPQGSVLNCQPPASVGNRMRVGWHLHPLLNRALESILPERVQAGNGLMHLVRLQARDADGTVAAGHFIAGGGRGAGYGRDGRGRDCFPSSARNVPVEELELRVPVLVTKRALRPGSGGDGRWQGALGHDVELARLPTFAGSLTAYVDADHLRSGPRGVAGGSDAEPFEAHYAGRQLPPEAVGVSGLELLGPDATLRLLVPGGGGYGRPELDESEDHG